MALAMPAVLCEIYIKKNSLALEKSSKSTKQHCQPLEVDGLNCVTTISALSFPIDNMLIRLPFLPLLPLPCSYLFSVKEHLSFSHQATECEETLGQTK